MNTFTPEQFLSQPSTPEDDLDQAPLDYAHVLPSNPLERLADALELVAATLTGSPLPSAPAASGDTQRLADLELETVELHELVDALNSQLEEIRDVVKPSVSKVAIAVREVLDRGQEPETPAEPEAGTAEAVPESNEPSDGAPADDAPVEEWRAYAKQVGADWPDLNHANRSMIRTRLGLAHPGTESADGAAG